MPSFSVLTFWHTYSHCHPNTGLKRTHYRLKNGHILLKNVFLKLNFQDKSRLYATCLFYILFFPLKCLLSQFFSRNIRMHISILTGLQNERVGKLQKNPHILSIGVFQAVSYCFFRNINKKLFFRFVLCCFFLYISKNASSKVKVNKNPNQRAFFNQKYWDIVEFSCDFITFHCFLIFD